MGKIDTFYNLNDDAFYESIEIIESIELPDITLDDIDFDSVSFDMDLGDNEKGAMFEESELLLEPERSNEDIDFLATGIRKQEKTPKGNILPFDENLVIDDDQTKKEPSKKPIQNKDINGKKSKNNRDSSKKTQKKDGKTVEKKQIINIYMSEDIRNKIKRKARDSRISINSLVLLMLLESIKNKPLGDKGIDKFSRFTEGYNKVALSFRADVTTIEHIKKEAADNKIDLHNFIVGTALKRELKCSF